MAGAIRRARKRAATVEPVDFITVIERHGMRCHLCGDEIKRGDLHFDHVVPLSKGGSHSTDNIKPSHSRCNLVKGAKLLPEIIEA